ncbi:hypothetical protein NGTWS0302_23140 [Mycolicibacterium cyprinidarum]|uniref:SHOCT domain-containing protein n=1 Tax=Mycolicibacterium cyprinidarum TaxID=2860311 RepID=A0ABQ4V5E9_9MYCO|nr:hypothetical protein NGTWS0302_23140 [Mycolicibacterium sp. NGTWS0302]GJF10689.1 hypothetical protein NGTWS1702_06810 [Mycolicibacterium sp. NGTWSNA01]
MTGRVSPRIAIMSAILTLVTAVVGFIVVFMLNAFVFDEFDAYGELPIPSSGSLHLPAGEVTINFHTAVPAGAESGFPVPPLEVGIRPRGGGPRPVVTESSGTTTSVNSDVRVRVWVVQIPRDGVYDIDAGGFVNGYINPRLAFGRDSSPGWLPWVFGGVFILGIAELVVAVSWRARSGKKAERPPGPVRLEEPSGPASLSPSVESYQPSDHGVRLEQLKTIAALRDSGALTESEFKAEKRRILGS